MLLFIVFLFTGSLHMVQVGWSESGVLAWNGFLSVVFFVQHSGMVRKRFRSHLANVIPPRYHGALFAIVSSLVLMSLVIFWQPSAVSLYELRGFSRWLARAIFFLAIVGFVWGMLALGSFDPFGCTLIRAHLRGEQVRPQPFVVRGPYFWVRHPLYFFVLLLIWSSPTVGAGRLLFNVLWSAWIYVGAILEEGDLLSDFGEAYRDYQRKVPMLIPWRRRSGS
jgi:protein-S-isoprenylcysteine O-methyltransferase Ste14